MTEKCCHWTITARRCDAVQTCADFPAEVICEHINMPDLHVPDNFFPPSLQRLSLFYLSPRRASISSPHRLLTSFSSLFGPSPLRLSLRLKKLEHFSLSSLSRDICLALLLWRVCLHLQFHLNFVNPLYALGGFYEKSLCIFSWGLYTLQTGKRRRGGNGTKDVCRT